MARPRYVACLLALLCGGLACEAREWPSAVPGHIEMVAREQACTPYGRLEGTDIHEDPWWVSLEPLTGGVDDSAFLCQTHADAATLVLLDVHAHPNPWAGCPSVVGELPWWPSGISFLTPEDPAYPRGTLGSWTDALGDPGPADVALTRPVLDTSLRIAGYLFYCHEGRWLALFEH
jgi:hypothetical protein